MNICESRIIDDLSQCGFSLVRNLVDEQSVDNTINYIADRLAVNTITKKVLAGSGDINSLPVHTENITEPEETMLGYFALACLNDNFSQGETNLYCAINAANLINKVAPEIANIEVNYTSLGNPQIKGAIHPLVANLPYGNIMRYRANVPSNNILSTLPEGYCVEDFYAVVDQVVDKSLITSHRWKNGDLLFINNRITLHSRNPYSGNRVVVRYRFDEGCTLIGG